MAFVDYLNSQLGEPKWNLKHSEAHFDCPFCTDTRKRFRFNQYKLVGLCFNCGWTGNAVAFVKDYHKIKTWKEALNIVNFYEDFRPLPTDVYAEVFDKLFVEDQDVEIIKHRIPLPDDFRLLSTTTSPRATIYWNYAYKRRLTNRQIEIHGVGYCPEGELKLDTPDGKKTMRLKDRLIVQTFDDDGKPIYWVGRSVNSDLKPKVLNPAGDVATIDKSDVIFNLNNAKRAGTIVLCEGVFSATTLGDFGVALFGKTMSVQQLLLLINSGADAIYVMLDPDAIEDAVKICELLSRHIPEVYFCPLKDGDPNDIGKEGCLKALKEAERYTALTALKYRLK